MVRVAGLSPESNWSHALFPVGPTGERARETADLVLDDPAEIDAFFARQAGR